jgi:hypothetical protein
MADQRKELVAGVKEVLTEEQFDKWLKQFKARERKIRQREQRQKGQGDHKKGEHKPKGRGGDGKGRPRPEGYERRTGDRPRPGTDGGPGIVPDVPVDDKPTDEPK